MSQNWEKIWNHLMDVYQAANKPRHQSVLLNHKNQKETILKKLGVVCEADVVRISNQLGVGQKRR